MRRILWLPVGRTAYLSILLKYVRKQIAAFDQIYFCYNVHTLLERQLVSEFASEFPDVVKFLDAPGSPGLDLSRYFNMPELRQEDALYIKCDDDIVFVEDGTFKAIFDYKQDNPKPFIVLPNIINNSVFSYLHQRRLVLSRELGSVACGGLCPIGWSNPNFAKLVHRTFLEDVAADRLDRYRFPPFELLGGSCVSINLICYHGADIAKLPPLRFADEAILCREAYGQGRPPILYGRKIVSHFSYHKQQRGLLDDASILARYEALSDK